MKLRQKRGGTLALVAAATITLILLGICFYFLATLFGGEREIQHATDSGNLNVAKNALRHPTITLKPGAEQETFGQLGDRSLINEAPPPAVPPVNLLTYDRLFGHTLLSAINVQNDESPEGKAHVAAMVKMLQEGADSIGGRLSEKLSAKQNNELFTNFGETANQNSLRMLGNQSTLTHNDSDFAVAYLEQTNQDIGATNIEVPSSLRSLFDTGLQSSLFTSKGGKTYIRGYVKPGITAGAPVGVPLQPGDQPHLVSNRVFSTQTSRGNTFAGTEVPPNGFRSHTAAAAEKAGQNATTLSCAEVGSLNMSFPLSIPYGYIKIQNGPDGGGSASVNGPFVGLNHVLNNELITGISVAGPVFADTDDKKTMEEWAKYNYNQSKGITPNPEPSAGTQGLFNLQGQPASNADAKNIPFDPNTGALVSTTCTDLNSTGWSRSDHDVVGQCWDLLGDGHGPGPFDAAFHPDASYTDSSDNVAGDLTSVECAKCQLQHKFNACGGLTVNSSNCAVTGLRTFGTKTASGFDKTGAYPSAPPMGRCKISHESSIKELGNFVHDSFGSRLIDLIAERARQIRPEDGEAQVRALIDGSPAKTWTLGEVAYIYVEEPDNKTDQHKRETLVMKSSAPPWADANTQPDGNPVTQSSGSYNITGGGGANEPWIVNPHGDGGIHDIMYREHPSSGINAVDTATWTPSSGFQNLLGKLQFTNSATGTAAGSFCKPD